MKKLLKVAYAALPFKQPVFTMLKQVWVPPHSVYKHLHFKGLLKIRVDAQKSFKMRHYGYSLENDLFWLGLKNGWEKHSMNLWLKLCKKSSVVFDIGANTGVYSLITKTINPQAKVYAFEPVKRVFEKLAANVHLNNFDVVCTEAAVSNNDGTATIFVPDTEHVYTVTVNDNILAKDIETVETKIKTITLKSFIEQNAIDRVDLIKLDVETHEPEVLEGFGDYLYLYKPSILIEILSDEVGKKVQTYAEKCGYLFFNIHEEKGIRKVDRINKSDTHNYFLCTEEVATSIHLI
jgi:FkbM family methyltransferase